MTLSALFFTSFLLGFSGALMPGPLLTVDIHESYRRGFIAGPLLILGHGILEVVLVAGLILGLSTLLVQPLFKGSIALMGGVVLFFMGWVMTRDSWLGRVSLELAAAGESKRMPPVLAGIVVSFCNPYWIIWWATIGLTYVTMAIQKGALAISVFMAGHLLADLTWYSAVSLAVVSGKKIISDRAYRGILIICGVFLVGLSVYFVWSGVKFILN